MKRAEVLHYKEGEDDMKREEIEKTLQEQLGLLAEASKEVAEKKGDEFRERKLEMLTDSIVKVAEILERCCSKDA